MKQIKDIDLKIGVSITLLGLLITFYLSTFENGGNHWDLFGTSTEKFLMKYGFWLVVFFSSSLIFPLLFKRDKKRIIVALISMPVYGFLRFSLFGFLD